MIDKILSAIKANNIDSYFIKEKNRQSAELFFIKKKLDLTRSTDVTGYTVAVYRNFEQNGKPLTGSATANIECGMDDAELIDCLKKAYSACLYAGNPAYKFGKGIRENVPDKQSKLFAQPLEKSAIMMSEALYKADCDNEAFINSAEIFVYKTKTRLVGSNGCDVSYTTMTAEGEFVAQCKAPQDVEIHHRFEYDELHTGKLTETAREMLQVVKARANAHKTTPKGNYRVILSDESVQTVLGFYAERASAHMIFPGYSDYKAGTDVMGENTVGERVNMKLIAKEPFSDEGVRMIDRQLLENGVVKTIQGNTRLSGYLGLQPTGQYRAYEAAAGTASIDKLREGDYLEVVRFSDFQIDPFDGYFGGEIRLAFLCRNAERIPVTGGSINGSFISLQKNIAFSCETQTSSTFVGPKYMRFENVAVNGE